MTERIRVALVSMPWHALDRPALGLSLLKAALERDGHGCDIRYLGFDLADSIGIEDYLWVHGELPYTAFAGDWIFTEALYGPRPREDALYLDRVLRAQWQRPEHDLRRLVAIRRRVESFLDHCMQMPWQEYDLVGFTSTFEQNVASLALAQRIAEAHPGVLIACGGANWEAEMGQSLHRRFSFVDLVASGEADTSFPALVNALAAGVPLGSVPGLVVRAADGSSVSTGAADPVRNLDELPVPRYEDYLAQRTTSPAAVDVVPTLLLESSRGCWWGAKHHCTFCGLNGGAMAFRSKTAERVLHEIDDLRGYGVAQVAVVDNILDMHYFHSLLPLLAERDAPLGMFYEVKANLSRDQVRLLAQAGINHIQPGIESLSDSVLRLMRKGTTALQNVRLLKWCAEFGVIPEWNFLYGFPGEDPGEYAAMTPLLDAITHLSPPSGWGPLRLDRFSPYHEDPADFGITNVRPFTPYRTLYDVAPEELMRIAYYFEFDYADARDLGYVAPALDRVKAWSAAGRQGTLTIQRNDDGAAVVLDSRGGPLHGHSLGPWQAALLDRLDDVTSHAAAVRQAQADGVDETTATEFLEACLRLRIVAHVGDRWLCLAVHQPPRWTLAGSSRAELQVLR